MFSFTLHRTHGSGRLKIFFGSQAISFAPRQYYGVESSAALCAAPQFAPVVAELGITHLITLQQTHSAAGYVVPTSPEVPLLEPYQAEGDYLITGLSGVGCGVATADCAPIILFDRRVGVFAIVHAGWRGAVNGVVVQAWHDLQQMYGSVPKDMQVVFGPCARVCCYEVDTAFVKARGGVACVERSGVWYFDLIEYLILQLQTLGFAADSMNIEPALCTICTRAGNGFVFCSYRRDGDTSRRQMTIAVLQV